MVLRIIKLHRLANETAETIGGRTTHPIRTMAGGWTMLPKPRELDALKMRFEDGVAEKQSLVSFLAHRPGHPGIYPRDRIRHVLTEPGSLRIMRATIRSSDVKAAMPLAGYRTVTNEYIVPQSTAKWAKFNRASYMVGALARVNNNFADLTPGAKAAAQQLGLTTPCCNPYCNTLAQAVECVHALETSARLADELLSKGLTEEKYGHTVREGQGASAVEAPRGILFHDYTYDKHGICTAANCIIPTNQNHANIQKDMEKLAPEFKDSGKEGLQRLLEMLVRAYDSVYFLSRRIERCATNSNSFFEWPMTSKPFGRSPAKRGQ